MRTPIVRSAHSSRLTARLIAIVSFGTRRGILAGTAILALGLLSSATHAAVNCVVSAGVTQSAKTVTGTTSDDTIACGGAEPGKKINAMAGNDTITGTAFAGHN